MNKKIFVILVHGTFALKKRKLRRLFPQWMRKLFAIDSLLPKGPDWVLYNSKLRKKLTEKSSNNIIYKTLLWTGDNSQKAREEGSERLKKRILLIKKYHPDSRIFVVGHSHGGSVAFMACNDTDEEKDKDKKKNPKINELVDGVITLSTPFLHFTENPRSAKIINLFPVRF